MKSAIFTVCQASLLPQAQVLLESLVKCAPECDLFLVVPEKSNSCSSGFVKIEKTTFITLEQLAVPNVERLAFELEGPEFCQMLIPHSIRYLFLQSYESVIYFEPESEVHASLIVLMQHFQESAAILCPYFTEPVFRNPSPLNSCEIQSQGIFNPGFLGLRKTTESENFLSFCCKQKSKTQAFFGSILSFLSPCSIIRNHSYGVSVLNLFQRHLRKEEGKVVTKDGPLVFLSFKDLNTAQMEISLDTKYAVQELIKNRTSLLKQAESKLSSFSRINSFDFFNDGERIYQADRRKFAALNLIEKDLLGDPFSAKLKIRQVNRVVGRIHDITEIAETNRKLHILLNDMQNLINNMQNLINNMQNGPSWIIGRLITFFPEN